MRTLLFLLLLTGGLGLARAQETKFPYDKGDEILNMKAVIKKIGDDTWYLAPLDNRSMRYIAMNLPEELHVEGLMVKVSGYTGKIPPMVKMLGTPMMLYNLRVLKKPKTLDKKLPKKYVFAPPAN